MSKFKETKMLGFSMPFFLIMVVVFMAIALTGSTMASFVGALGFCLIVGTLIGWVGDRIPIWKDWLGGGMLLASIGTSALVMFNLIPAETADILSNFNNTMGFLDLYILTLITGAILSIDRKLLIRAFAGFIPAILGGVADRTERSGSSVKRYASHHGRRKRRRLYPHEQHVGRSNGQRSPGVVRARVRHHVSGQPGFRILRGSAGPHRQKVSVPDR